MLPQTVFGLALQQVSNVSTSMPSLTAVHLHGVLMTTSLTCCEALIVICLPDYEGTT